MGNTEKSYDVVNLDGEVLAEMDSDRSRLVFLAHLHARYNINVVPTGDVERLTGVPPEGNDVYVDTVNGADCVAVRDWDRRGGARRDSGVGRCSR